MNTITDRIILIGLFANIVFFANAQEEKKAFISPSQFGFTGLIYTPSAYMPNWKTIDASFTHFSKETSFTYQRAIEAERAINLNFVFIPRIEISVKLTRPYSNLRPDYQPGTGQARNWGIGDRSYSLRVKILEEKKYQPSLVIGVQDPFANLAYFNTNYLIASKKIKFNEINISMNIGYGTSWEETQEDYLQGVFGGLKVVWKNINAVMEHDTKHINIGLGYQFKKHIFFNLALIDAKHFSGNVTYRFQLQ